MRVAKACVQCRSAKRKCCVDQDGPCKPCRQKNHICSLAPEAPLLRKASQIITPAIDEHLLPTETRVELIDLYLEFLHGKPHTLFHPKQLRAAAHHGIIPNHVLLPLAGLACRFSESSELRSRKQQFMLSAKETLKSQLDDFSLDTIRGCILVGNLYGAEGDAKVESLFFALAFRIALILGLPEPGAEDNQMVREEKVRTWWSLYMIDRWSSAGLNVPRQIPDDRLVPFPIDELDFYSMESNLATYDRKPGLWHQMVRIARIFGQVQDLHKQHASGDIDVLQVETITGKLWSDLENFKDQLPLHFRLDEENLRHHAELGLGRDFVALHLGYYHYATLLFFPYLDMQLEASPVQRVYASRCKENAAALSDLLRLSYTMDDCRPVYFIVAHMTAVSSSALLHDLLFGDEQNLQATRERLEANFQVLIQLRDIWPAAWMLTDRLFKFQNMCLKSADPNTHKADRWMVKFLLQHAFPIDEKTETHSSGSKFVNGLDRGKYASDTLSILRT
ncbi:hypothetical protein BS50DRAFT_505911 [Corynespora cassiicola Philippines]|uniref:Zn(2)-C6 fungal-type domain-containing protein n=1 Tax=Corynespora cassiicola Philippines TaxID=1448308 RepID=A0A2T2N5N3_CORCC|nr:hypothetical protein BS50DRAFT_505911 [Corynespora cassiicola Philippines]